MKKKPSTVRKTAKSTIFSGVRRGYFDWLDHHYQVETELQSCNTPQGYMLTLVDVTKILEQNHRMKELVTQAEAATQAKSAFVSIYPMRSVPYEFHCRNHGSHAAFPDIPQGNRNSC